MAKVRRDILLVEPDYRNKYPPLGLMKIASYHRLRGDRVAFVKGCFPEHRDRQWDRIYITSLFSFYWNKTVQTIRYYARSTARPEDVYVGGILATLMADELRAELHPLAPVTVVEGLLDKPGMLDDDSSQIVERMIPNYAILDDIDYTYGTEDAYLGYATRGCVNKCRFCAVQKLEPNYLCGYHTSIFDLVRSIDTLYGPKRDLLLLDNNILASPDFKRIMHEILDSGFERGATFNNRHRRLDFNQGIDARLLNVTKMKLLARTAIKPLRLAFDQIRMKKSYERAVRLACEHGLDRHSTYVLYNYNDTPEDFYHRLKINLDINEELGAKISSFPMKYIPLNSKNRRYVGKHWHRTLVRGVQCILLATRGMVSPRREFFEAAFGRDEREFRDICMMPEHYIIYRRKNDARATEWRKQYHRLGDVQRVRLLEVLAAGSITKAHCEKESGSLRKVMEHYIDSE